MNNPLCQHKADPLSAENTENEGGHTLFNIIMF
jgi:hypothetical protein